MFFRTKSSGPRTYLQVVENRWEGGRSRQRVVATLGRLDQLRDSGQLDALLISGARLAHSVMILSAHAQGRLLRLRGGIRDHRAGRPEAHRQRPDDHAPRHPPARLDPPGEPGQTRVPLHHGGGSHRLARALLPRTRRPGALLRGGALGVCRGGQNAGRGRLRAPAEEEEAAGGSSGRSTRATHGTSHAEAGGASSWPRCSPSSSLRCPRAQLQRSGGPGGSCRQDRRRHDRRGAPRPGVLPRLAGSRPVPGHPALDRHPGRSAA